MSMPRRETPQADERKLDLTLLTPADVAEVLRISRSAAYALMSRGDLPVVHIGRSVRVRPLDLQAFIAGKRQPAKVTRL